MAKRASRREPEEDVEDAADEGSDDGMGWPAKKGGSAKAEKAADKPAGKKKGDTGKVKRGDSGKAPGLKDSGKRKTSGVRKASSGGDDDEGGGDEKDMSSSARRRRAAPIKKKDNTNTVVMAVSMISITLILCIGIVIWGKRKTPVEGRDETKMFDGFKGSKEAGMKAFREFNKAEKDGNAALAKSKHKEAHDHLSRAVDQLNEVLSHHQVDGQTDPQYEGYESELSEISQILVDLEKRGQLR